MASALKKRKRGQVEVVSASKRAKSAKAESPLATPQLAEGTGWDAAFAPPKDLMETNGIHGNSHSHGGPDSLEVLNYEDYEKSVRMGEAQLQEVKRKQKPKKQMEKHHGKHNRKLLKKVLATNDHQPWKLSEPIGGRQINVEPVFTMDEQ